MTVKELIKALSKYPDNTDVFMDERLTEFKYGLVNGVKCKTINFMEDPNGPILATGEAVVLTEE